MYSADTKILTKLPKCTVLIPKYRVDMKEIKLAKVFYPYFELGIAICCILGLKKMSVKSHK